MAALSGFRFGDDSITAPGSQIPAHGTISTVSIVGTTGRAPNPKSTRPDASCSSRVLCGQCPQAASRQPRPEDSHKASTSPHDRPIGCGPLRRASGHRYWSPVAVRGVRNRARLTSMRRGCGHRLNAGQSNVHRRALTCCCHAAACVATRSRCAWPCNCREYEVNKCDLPVKTSPDVFS